MNDTIRLGDIEIEVTRKAVKHAHLSVHPPHGRVSLVAPAGTRLEVARAFAITKLAWIRQQRSQLSAQAREAPRRFVQRETHHLWGRRHLLAIRISDAKPAVSLDHRRITLTIRPDTSAARRAEVMLLDDLRIGGLDERAELAERLPAPVAQILDARVDLLGRRVARGLHLVHDVLPHPGSAAACRTHLVNCASSMSSSCTSIQRASFAVPPPGDGISDVPLKNVTFT